MEIEQLEALDDVLSHLSHVCQRTRDLRYRFEREEVDPRIVEAVAVMDRALCVAHNDLWRAVYYPQLAEPDRQLRLTG